MTLITKREIKVGQRGQKWVLIIQIIPGSLLRLYGNLFVDCCIHSWHFELPRSLPDPTSLRADQGFQAGALFPPFQFSYPLIFHFPFSLFSVVFFPVLKSSISLFSTPLFPRILPFESPTPSSPFKPHHPQNILEQVWSQFHPVRISCLTAGG